jgi:hypothetical protein
MNTVSRNTTIPGEVILVTFTRADNSPPLSVPLAISDYVTYEEEMTPNSGRPRNVWKNFEHRKAFRPNQTSSLVNGFCAGLGDFYPNDWRSYQSHPRFGIGGYSTSDGGVGPFGEPGLPLTGLPDFVVRRPDGGFIPSPANYADLENMAMRTMMPGIKAELSIINSLIELKDFKTLPATLNSIAGLALKAKTTLRKYFKTGADGYLQLKFNILPLLSDISGIHTALSRTERRINDLVTRSGRVQRRHFVYNWSEFTDTDIEYNDSAYWPLPYHNGIVSFQYISYNMSRRAVHKPSSFHAMIEYNYNFTQYQLEHAQVLGLLDALGANLNPQIIWNAIPWSFVVDWVISVGRFLDNFKVANMEPKINILRYLWSIKRERLVYTERLANNQPAVFGPQPPPYFQKTPLPVVVETAFRRHVTLPSTSSILLSGVSSTEFTLGAALVIARSKRSRNR